MEMTPKQLEQQRENHYVWANYLKNWSLNNLDVWYTTKKHKIAHDSVKAILKEKDFYRYQFITEQNLELINFISNVETTSGKITLQSFSKESLVLICISKEKPILQSLFSEDFKITFVKYEVKI
ncbi:DUF4238 domain-containing protein [Acinetobacter baumannii]|nr:DUF4238 domain-containing protein [Acinetobacter baumannii]MDC5547404.1 DUF4238 domain-containing protein [Acinetobacter baumannii]